MAVVVAVVVATLVTVYTVVTSSCVAVMVHVSYTVEVDVVSEWTVSM